MISIKPVADSSMPQLHCVVQRLDFLTNNILRAIKKVATKLIRNQGDKMSDNNLRIWDKIAGAHESTIPLDFAGHIKHIDRAAKVVEVGCGYGRVMTYLSALGFRNLMGIDGSQEMLRRAQDRGYEHLLRASGANVPLPANSVDLVVYIGTLSSVSKQDERIACFGEIRRILRPNGHVIVRDFAITLSPRRLLRYIWFFLRGHNFGNFRSVEGIEFHHFRAKELRGLATQAGLRVVTLTEEQFTTMHGNRSLGLTLVATYEQ